MKKKLIVGFLAIVLVMGISTAIILTCPPERATAAEEPIAEVTPPDNPTNAITDGFVAASPVPLLKLITKEKDLKNDPCYIVSMKPLKGEARILIIYLKSDILETVLYDAKTGKTERYDVTIPRKDIREYYKSRCFRASKWLEVFQKHENSVKKASSVTDEERKAYEAKIIKLQARVEELEKELSKYKTSKPASKRVPVKVVQQSEKSKPQTKTKASSKK
ncbi:hypothetical protein FACS1894187_14920 [Synergistales bacterium]|nr:hypothetical protein FACS1894187_14920 [Synergistales bacterium]